MKQGREQDSQLIRVLVIYYVLRHSREFSPEDLKDVPVSRKTIQRDIALIREAGNIVRYHAKRQVQTENGPETVGGTYRSEKYGMEPRLGKNLAHNRTLTKLNRLFYIMDCAADAEFDVSCYREKFPGLSRRTMQRDFASLRQIGFDVGYEENDDYGFEPDAPRWQFCCELPESANVVLYEFISHWKPDIWKEVF